MSIKYREFVRHAGKYVKAGVVIELEDRDFDIVCQTKSPGKELERVNHSMTNSELNKKTYDTHACGCKKGDSYLCKKHHRV